MTTINKRKLSPITKQWLQLVNVQTIEQLQALDWSKESIRAQLGNYAAVTVSREAKKLLAAAPQLIKVYEARQQDAKGYNALFSDSLEIRRRDNHTVMARNGTSYMSGMNYRVSLYNKDGEFIKMINVLDINEAYSIMQAHVESLGMEIAPY